MTNPLVAFKGLEEKSKSFQRWTEAYGRDEKAGFDDPESEDAQFLGKKYTSHKPSEDITETESSSLNPFNAIPAHISDCLSDEMLSHTGSIPDLGNWITADPDDQDSEAYNTFFTWEPEDSTLSVLTKLVEQLKFVGRIKDSDIGRGMIRIEWPDIVNKNLMQDDEMEYIIDIPEKEEGLDSRSIYTQNGASVCPKLDGDHMITFPGTVTTTGIDETICIKHFSIDNSTWNSAVEDLRSVREYKDGDARDRLVLEVLRCGKYHSICKILKACYLCKLVEVASKVKVNKSPSSVSGDQSLRGNNNPKSLFDGSSIRHNINLTELELPATMTVEGVPQFFSLSSFKLTDDQTTTADKKLMKYDRYRCGDPVTRLLMILLYCGKYSSIKKIVKQQHLYPLIKDIRHN